MNFHTKRTINKKNKKALAEKQQELCNKKPLFKTILLENNLFQPQLSDLLNLKSNR